MTGSEDLERVLAALPHRDPFRFISALTSLTPLVRATGEWILAGDETFFQGHFPSDPIVPGVLIAEALAQLCGLVAFGEPGGTSTCRAHLTHFSIKIHAAARPPVRISLSASLIRSMGHLVMFETAAKVNDVVIADGSLVLAIAATSPTC